MNKHIVQFFGLYFLFFNIPSFSMELIKQQQKNKGKGKESDSFLIETAEIAHKLDSLSVATTKYEKDLSVLENQVDLQEKNIFEIEQLKKNEEIEDYNLSIKTDREIRELKIFGNSVTKNRINLSLQVKQTKDQYQAILQQENKDISDEVNYNRINSLERALKNSKERLSSYNQQIKSQVQIISKLKQPQKTEKPSTSQEGSNPPQQIQSSGDRLQLTSGMITSLIDSVPEIRRIINTENAQIQETNVRCILLTGLSGTGKTTLAEIIAHELKREFLKLTPASEGTEFQYSLRHYLKKETDHIFASNKKYVVLIDEIDQLTSPNPDSKGDNPANALNMQIDKAKRDARNIIFVGTTNNEGNLIKSLYSRFKVIKLELPNDKLRAALLIEFINKCNYNLDSKYYINTSTYESDESIKALTQETKNFSIRELEMLIENAAEIAKDEYLSTQEQTPPQEQVDIKIINLTKEHMSRALSEIKPQIISAEKTWTKSTEIWIKNFGPKLSIIAFVAQLAFTVIDRINKKNDKIREEERYNKMQEQYEEQKRRDEERYRNQIQQHTEQKNLEKKQLEEQNSWTRTITNVGEKVATAVIWIAGAAIKEHLQSKKK